MAEFHNAPEIRQNEALPPKGVSKETTEKKEHPGTQAALAFVERNFWDLPDEDKVEMKIDESTAFLGANPGAADLFARVIKHCENSGSSDELTIACSKKGLPVSVSDVSKLAEKFEIAQTAEVAAKTETVAAKTETVAAKTETDTSKDKADASENEKKRLGEFDALSTSLLKRREDLAIKYGERLEVWKNNPNFSKEEKTALARDILSDLKKSFEDAKANGSDTSKAAEDLKFFAEKFRDLGVISHQDFRDLFKNDSQKSGPDTNKSPADGRTALVGNFNSTGDGRTFFALDRTYPGVWKFDEFVRVSPDGKTASKEIVGKYGYSLTVEPVPLETGKAAAREILAWAESDVKHVTDQAKFVEETFGPEGSKIPPPEDPKFKEYKEAVDKIAKDKGVQIDEQDPKKTLAAVKDSIKTSYAQALEKTSKAQAELKELQKESDDSSVKDGEKKEEQAREAMVFLDRTGISALGPKATEELLKKFGAAGCENGKPVNLEKFLKNQDSLATEFRAFVSERLKWPESVFFATDGNPPPALRMTMNGEEKPFELKAEFKKIGLLTEDGHLSLERASAPKPETQTA